MVWKGHIVFLCSLVLLSISLVNCSTRKTLTITNVPGGIINEEYFKQVVWGGYCIAPEGQQISNACQAANAIQRVEIYQYIPQDVTLEHIVNPATSGGGYIYRLRWDFPSPAYLEKTEARIDWNIYEDPSGAIDADPPDFEIFLKTLQKETINYFSTKEFIPNKLYPGRRYVYYLTAKVFGIREPERLLVLTEVLYRRIVIDLTEATPR